LRKMTDAEFEDFATQAGFIDQYRDRGSKRENIIALVLGLDPRESRKILNRWYEILKENKSQEGELPIDVFAKINSRILLSSRDKEEIQKEFDSEEKTKFSKDFNATTLAKEFYNSGYKDEKSMIEQFKERNFEINDVVKNAIKDVIDCIEKKENVGFSKK